MSDTTKTAPPTAKSPKQLRKDRWVLWGILSGVFLVGPVFLTALISLSVYDNNHRVSIECTVTGAEFHIGGRGAKATTKSVRIDTSDCGILGISRVDASTSFEAVAAELAPGGRYVFEAGKGTLSLPPWVPTTVYSYEKID